MKNCLIVFAVLFGCFIVALVLVIGFGTNWGRGFAGGDSLMVGLWTYYDDPALEGMQIVLLPDQIIVFVPDQTTTMKRYARKGRWNSHGFYVDSHTDSPKEIMIANELPNEDLEVNLKYFSPTLPEKAVCVLMRRNPTTYHPYPVATFGQTVTYPPPKGLIRRGMLECDLRTLPWRPDNVQLPDIVVNARTQTLSDGTVVPVPPDALDNPPQNAVYTYHSDRGDAPKLLVTVYHGRVIGVAGGAEDTADIPYRPPPPPSDPAGSPGTDNSTWVGWLFNLLFSK